jgi:hypothetical protein
MEENGRPMALGRQEALHGKLLAMVMVWVGEDLNERWPSL